MNNELQVYLSECFEYDEYTGDLIWKERPRRHFKTNQGHTLFNNRYANKIAGTIIKIGSLSYRKIGVTNLLKSPIGAHSVVWMLVHGECPDVIDHIDGNGLNNRIDNLRNVSHSENLRNSRISKANTSGCTGVYWNKNLNKWISIIRVDCKSLSLGYFEDWFEAVCARKSAENKYGYHENHGRPKL